MADRAIKAAELAIASPLLEASIEGAHGVLLSIQGSSNLALSEIYEASSLVQDVVHPEANIIFGTVIDDTLGDEVRVTVIAAGFDNHELPQASFESRTEEQQRRASYATPQHADFVSSEASDTQVVHAEDLADSGPILAAPVEASLADPAFSDDDEIDIPDFLK